MQSTGIALIILRKILSLEYDTFITVEQLDILIDHFKCDITLYTLKDKMEIIKNTNKYDIKFEAFLDTSS